MTRGFIVKLPMIRGIIDRRILINFRVDPEIVRPMLPEPLHPRLHDGHAIAGVCLIRLTKLRPNWLPQWLGMSSEGAAHRISVCWEEAGIHKTGVFVPRRDSSSRINGLLGGRLFPGVHHHALFEFVESENQIEVSVRDREDRSIIRLSARLCDEFPASSIFGSLDAASRFLEDDKVGISPRRLGRGLEALELKIRQWKIRPVNVSALSSSFFDDRTRFPSGSATLDCAVHMSDIEHEWRVAQTPVNGANLPTG